MKINFLPQLQLIPAAPIIAGAVSLFDSIFNSSSQSNTNQASMDFQTSMYKTQRKDAISDRDYANNYNSPAQAMARLKAAGLNPNLVYGQGAANNVSSPVRSASAESPKISPPQMNSQGVVNALMSFYEVQKTQAQTDNLKAQIEAMKTKMALDQAKIPLTNSQTVARDNQNRYDNELHRYNLEHLQMQNRVLDKQAYKIDADRQFTEQQKEINKMLSENTVAETVSKILQRSYQNAKTALEKAYIAQQIKNAAQDNEIKQLDFDLYKNKGITKQTPGWKQKAMETVNHWIDIIQGNYRIR